MCEIILNDDLVMVLTLWNELGGSDYSIVVVMCWFCPKDYLGLFEIPKDNRGGPKARTGPYKIPKAQLGALRLELGSLKSP